MIHISIDDFFVILKEITEREAQYGSLFEYPVFAFFKQMHEQYDAVFHCYCFGEDKEGFSLAGVTRKFRQEFERNAEWLQFGFHGINYDAVYGDNGGTRVINRNVEQAAEDYAFVMGQLAEIVGKRALDFTPRIHFFAGTKDCCKAWKDAKYGIKGLLAADDDRYSYYHNSSQHDELIAQNVWYDAELELLFRRTNIRLENEKDIGALRRKVRAFADGIQVVFTHECFLQQEEMQQKIEACLQEALLKGK